MKRIQSLLLVLLFSISIFSQNNWDLIWTLDQKPFIEGKTDSEMAIVKAGYDTDQDGWGEFLCAWTDKENNYILMYEASADNTYDLVWYWQYSVASNSFAGIEIGDFDQNGKVEIITTVPTVVTGGSPDRIWFFEWSGNVGENLYGQGELGSIAPTRSWNFDVEDDTDFRPYGITMDDIDNDGDNELIVGVRMGGRGREVIVFSITGGELFGFGAFKIEFNHQESLQGSLYNTTIGDLDNDGNKEIYALVWADMTVRFFEVIGPDQYELVTSLDSVTAGIDYGALDGIRVADANNDGVNELYFAGTEPTNTVFMITGISDISQITEEDIITFYQIPVNALGKLRSMYIADPDNDGNISLLIAGEQNGQIYELEYSGSGDPADSANWDLSVIFDIYEYSGFSPDSSQGINTIDPRLFYGSYGGDMDQDGKNEYAFVNYRSSFSIWEGDNYVWIIENDQIVGVESPSVEIPERLSLGQNFPNPFNPTTKIEFKVAKRGEVEISVYDLLGNKIETLISENMDPGEYIVNFDGSGLASGSLLL